ncbi:hypothetical protein ACEY2E_00530 [Metamycoplasma salivarium]|uniref:hypothetical protein n=1 Tax=Metamycoplasma salivarium TaxID=2124 RepID=UPI0035BBB5D9
MNKKLLLGTLTSLPILPVVLLSTSAINNKKIENNNTNKNSMIKNQTVRQNSKLKYVITIDNQEMTFDSKEEIYKYLVNRVQVNGYLGKKEYKNYDGQIDMDPNKLNLVDFSKMKKAYKDIHGNYSDDLDSVIRSYLPEFAIVKRYYDHRNQPFKDPEAAKNSIIQNSADDIVDNLFYKLNYHYNGQTIEKHYNPYNKYDIEELMQDIYDRKVLGTETKTFQALKLNDEDGNERLLSYKGQIENFFTTLFNNAIKDFTNQAAKKRYKVTLKLPRMDNMNYPNYGKAYFKNFASDSSNEWQYNGTQTEIYKYVDEEWIEKYFEELEVLKKNDKANEFVSKNFNRYYSKRLTKEIKNPNYKPNGNGRQREYFTRAYYNHYADLKGDFLDFKYLNLAAENYHDEYQIITILNHDRWTYNNFGMEINVEFDKNDFENKINSLKNEFMEKSNSFNKFQNLLINAIEKINKTKYRNYFNNLDNGNSLLKMLYEVFKQQLNDFTINNTNNKQSNYVGLKFNDSKIYYQDKNDNNWTNSLINLNLWKSFNGLSVNINTINITYYKTLPIFYKNENYNFINLTNKDKKSNEYFDFIKPNEIIELINNEKFTESQKQLAKERKLNYIDNYSNYFYLENLETFKYKNFIQYKESSNGSYQLNNSYSPLKTFKNDTEVNAYLKRIKEDGILPETRYTIVGLESTLDSNGIKMLLDELGFNDPSTITNNYRMILQKLILPSTEKIFYLNNGHKYLLDLKYFNLWNVKINNEKYHFESSQAITKFIINYVNLNAKPIVGGIR